MNFNLLPEEFIESDECSKLIRRVHKFLTTDRGQPNNRYWEAYLAQKGAAGWDYSTTIDDIKVYEVCARNYWAKQA